MQRIIYIGLLGLFICANVISSASAGSIWAKRGKHTRAVYTDDVARSIGDVLTILISEDSKVDNKIKRDLSKETERSNEFDGNLGITTPNHNLLPRMPGFTMEATGTNELKSKADFQDQRKFVDRVTVTVVDILPNRNLVVAGTRYRNIAGDVQTIEVSGIVRPSDIAFDNTIQSQQVADFRLYTKNTGVSDPYTKPGWLGRIFDVLWPF